MYLNNRRNPCFDHIVVLGCDFFSSLPLNEVEAAEVSVMAILRSIASGHYDGVPSVFSSVNSFPRLGLANNNKGILEQDIKSK